MGLFTQKSNVLRIEQYITRCDMNGIAIDPELRWIFIAMKTYQDMLRQFHCNRYIVYLSSKSLSGLKNHNAYSNFKAIRKLCTQYNYKPKEFIQAMCLFYINCNNRFPSPMDLFKPSNHMTVQQKIKIGKQYLNQEPVKQHTPSKKYLNNKSKLLLERYMNKYNKSEKQALLDLCAIPNHQLDYSFLRNNDTYLELKRNGELP